MGFLNAKLCIAAVVCIILGVLIHTYAGDLIGRYLRSAPIIFPWDRVAPKPNAVKMGIISTGNQAYYGAAVPSRYCSGVSVNSVASRTLNRANAFAEQCGNIEFHASYTTLFQDDAIDAVYIATPTSLHFKHAASALQAGKHVLLETPLTLTSDDAEILMQMAQSRGLVLFEGMAWRYHPAAIHAMSFIRLGDLGVVKHIEVRMSWFEPILFYYLTFSPRTYRPKFQRTRGDLPSRHAQQQVASFSIAQYGDVGARIDQEDRGSEKVRRDMEVEDLNRWIYYGVDVITCIATVAGLEGAPVLESANVDQNVEAKFRFENGVTAALYVNRVKLGMPEFDLSVVGSAKELLYRNFDSPSVFHEIRVTDNSKPELTNTDHLYRYGESKYEHQLEAFYEAVRKSATFPSNAANAIANLRIVAAINETRTGGGGVHDKDTN